MKNKSSSIRTVIEELDVIYNEPQAKNIVLK